MKRPDCDLADLRALRDKYERMLALREAHARASVDPAFREPDPRGEMAKLADEFPGALREIDTLPLGLIGARIEALRSAERDASSVEPWMLAQMTFHRHARGVLVTKRWLAGRRAITPAVRQAFTTALRTLPWRDDAALFAEELDVVAAPPRGRLMDVVHLRVARALTLTADEVRVLVFGAGARRR